MEIYVLSGVLECLKTWLLQGCAVEKLVAAYEAVPMQPHSHVCTQLRHTSLLGITLAGHALRLLLAPSGASSMRLLAAAGAAHERTLADGCEKQVRSGNFYLFLSGCEALHHPQSSKKVACAGSHVH